jgi:hypothetical protein
MTGSSGKSILPLLEVAHASLIGVGFFYAGFREDGPHIWAMPPKPLHICADSVRRNEE